MPCKTYIPEGEAAPPSQIGASLDTLAQTIQARRCANDPASYTCRLMSGNLEDLCKKLSEEALEASMAAKEAQMLDAYATDDLRYDEAVDHLRYEAADVLYHLMVLLARFDIANDEFAAELNTRMAEAERPAGGIKLYDEFVRRGK